MRTLIILPIVLVQFACFQQPETDQSIDLFVEESIEMALETGDGFLHSTQKNYYENPRKAGPFYSRGLQLDSISKSFLNEIDRFQKNKSPIQLSEIKESYNVFTNQLIQSLRMAIIPDSFILPINITSEKWELNLMKMNIVKLRNLALAEILANTESSYCGFEPIRLKLTKQFSANNEQIFFLSDKILNATRDKNVRINSVSHNGVTIPSPFKDSTTNYFHTIYADFLSPGKYVINGDVIVIAPGGKKLEFDFEKEIIVE